MKIYTRNGDKGTTRLVDGSIISKNDRLVSAYGSVDELCSQIGLLHSLYADNLLVDIQRQLFSLGAHLASACSIGFKGDVKAIENAIDKMQEQLPECHSFIIPGGTTRAALSHVCRTVCRRAERDVVEVSAEYSVAPEAMAWLNRLSDYFFVLARYLNFIDKVEEKNI